MDQRIMPLRKGGHVRSLLSVACIVVLISPIQCRKRFLYRNYEFRKQIEKGKTHPARKKLRTICLLQGDTRYVR